MNVDLIRQWIDIGVAVGAFKGLEAAWRWFTGRSGVQRSRMSSLIRERDAADAYRRKVEEFASQVVRAFYLAGGKPSELPAWPRPPMTPDDPSGNNGPTKEEGVPHA